MASQSISPFQAFLMVLLIIFWGSSFVVVKQLLDVGLTPIAVATFRFLLAGVLFLVALAIKKRVSPTYRLSVERKDLLVLLVLALDRRNFLLHHTVHGNSAGRSFNSRNNGLSAFAHIDHRFLGKNVW